MKNLTSRGLLTLGYSGSITTSTSGSTGHDPVVLQNCAVLVANASVKFSSMAHHSGIVIFRMTSETEFVISS